MNRRQMNDHYSKDRPWKILILQYDVDTACLYLSTNGSDENIDAETLDSQSKYILFSCNGNELRELEERRQL